MERVYKSQDNCPIARTLDVIGDRWTFLVLRGLFVGQNRFTDMLESLGGISPNLLADRLKRLEQVAIVERVFYSDHPPRAEYRLTEKGRALGPVLHALGEWGAAYELSEEQKADPALVEAMARMSAAVSP